jgi:hypothetical protein
MKLEMRSILDFRYRLESHEGRLLSILSKRFGQEYKDGKRSSFPRLEKILVKAVAQAIPIYAMSCFDLTKGLCEELSMMIGRYWWSQQDKVHKIHWLS